MRRSNRTSRGLLLTLAVLWGFASEARAQDPAKDFRQNCASCHTIGGGRLTGPDLKDVGKRKDRPWLIEFIVNPNSKLDAGDPYALQLLEEARNVRMPPLAGMTADRASALLDLIEAESRLEKSRFAGLQISSRPFTPAEIERGRALFTGEIALRNGGGFCLSCHTVGGMGGLGGGRLGPDLTRVFERYQDRQTLANWLRGPATPTMLPTFRNRELDADTEILPLVAFFEDAVKSRREQQGAHLLAFALIGAGGAVLVLLLMDRLWRRRFRAVRKPLLSASSVARRLRASARSTHGEAAEPAREAEGARIP